MHHGDGGQQNYDLGYRYSEVHLGYCYLEKANIALAKYWHRREEDGCPDRIIWVQNIIFLEYFGDADPAKYFLKCFFFKINFGEGRGWIPGSVYSGAKYNIF